MCFLCPLFLPSALSRNALLTCVHVSSPQTAKCGSFAALFCHHHNRGALHTELCFEVLQDAGICRLPMWEACSKQNRKITRYGAFFGAMQTIYSISLVNGNNGGWPRHATNGGLRVPCSGQKNQYCTASCCHTQVLQLCRCRNQKRGNIGHKCYPSWPCRNSLFLASF